MCIFDCVKDNKGWKADPNMSLSDNVLYGSIHFTRVFFGKYRVRRYIVGLEEYDDMASDCSVALYEYAMHHIDKWDMAKYRLDQFMYGRAWSYVATWLKSWRYHKTSSYLSDQIQQYHNNPDKELDPTEYDFHRGRYPVFKARPRNDCEKECSDIVLEYLDYVSDCEYYGLNPTEPEDFVTNRTGSLSDVEQIKRFLDNELVRAKRAAADETSSKRLKQKRLYAANYYKQKRAAGYRVVKNKETGKLEWVKE